MKAWTLVPSSFGLWWLASGLSALSALTNETWVILTAGAFLVAATGFLFRPDRQGSFDRRTFRYSLIVESIGIVGVVVICVFMQRSSLIMPLIGVVVGLHFIPLARAFGDRSFIVTGCLMTGTSLAALIWSPPLNTAISGIGVGAILWTSAVWISLRRRWTALTAH